MQQYLDRHRFLKGIYLMVRRYFDHHVGRDSAALTYYLLFALFPLLIFLSNLVGIMSVDISGFLYEIRAFIPQEALEIIEQYFTYVSRDSSPRLLWFSLIFPFTFLTARQARFWALSVGPTASTGPRSFALSAQAPALYAEPDFNGRFVHRTVRRRRAGAELRVEPPVGLYHAERRLHPPVVESALCYHRRHRILPHRDDVRPCAGVAPDEPHLAGRGVLARDVARIVIPFSYYVENIARYSVIYGTLGAVIVLLLWLYLASVMLIMGAEFNSVLMVLRKQHTAEAEENLGETQK